MGSLLIRAGCFFAGLLVFLSSVSSAEDCSPAKVADIVFLLDGSGSVGSEGFQDTLSFVSNIVDVFAIGPTTTQIGQVVFGTNLSSIYQLNTHHNKTSIKQRIQNTTYPNGWTSTDTALKYVRTTMFQESNGMRISSQKIAIVITDGRSDSPQETKTEACKLRDAGVTIIAVGVGHANTDEVKNMATDNFAYSVDNYSKIFDLNGPLSQAACGDINECVSSPCKLGDCHDRLNGYICACQPGYTGLQCQIDIDECETRPRPCNGVGNCTDKINDVSCVCESGYTGNYCETDINECLSSPCKHGDCNDRPNGYICACQPGYTGLQCQIDIDECETRPRPCNGVGNCTDKINDVSCVCESGYTGNYCETDINECLSSPCKHGDCNDRPNGYICACQPGYTGLQCQIDIDECETRPRPCNGVGNCTDKINDVSCVCESGYTGSYCETDIDECQSSPCLNGGTCQDRVNAFSCICAHRYYGDTCDTGICQPTVADLVFVLDSSISQSHEDFTRQLDFIIHFVDHIIISERDFQVAVVTYSFDAKVEFYLNDNGDNVTLKSAIGNVQFRPGATFTDKGLKASEDVFNKDGSARSNGKTAKRFVFVLTDGMSTNRIATKHAAAVLKTKVTKVIAIGIGTEVSHQELLDIASPGDAYSPEYVFSVHNFNALYSIVKQLVHFTCDECLNTSSSEVVFLLDVGVNITGTDFDVGIDAITYIVDKLMDIRQNNSISIGLATYGDSVSELRKLNGNVGREAWLPFLQTLVLQSQTCDRRSNSCQGSNILHESLKHARKHMFTNSGVLSEVKLRKIVIILSNGKFEISNALENELVSLANEHVFVFVIGLGDAMQDIEMSVLLSLVTDPNNVFLSNLKGPLTNLDALLAEFVFNSCELTNEV